LTHEDAIMQDPPLTIGAVARRYGCHAWQIRRLFERGLLPPAPRVGAYRVIAASDLPQIEEALRAAGYLPNDAAELARQGGGT
jgi:DNA-binding transcriptional MerR regulator